jgi:hypothetical protein
MASEKTYPKISRKMWFLVRERLKKSLPTSISPTLITSLSSMTEGSAKSNVIAPMRELGLVDEHGKPTQLAERWRHDDDYKTVCDEIRIVVYPTDLIEAFTEPQSSQKVAIKSWFMKAGKVGDAAAKMYADTYLLLSEADYTKTEKQSTKSPADRLTTPAPKSKARMMNKKVQAKSATDVVDSSQEETPPQDRGGAHRKMPSVHIDVQVHISPDTSPEQIDRIFESMSKHLGGFTK